MKVTVNDEEAWSDVRGGCLDREKIREAKVTRRGLHEGQEALGRSLKKHRVSTQDGVGEVGGHEERHRGEPRNTVQARIQGFQRLRQGSGGSFFTGTPP